MASMIILAILAALWAAVVTVLTLTQATRISLGAAKGIVVVSLQIVWKMTAMERLMAKGVATLSAKAEATALCRMRKVEALQKGVRRLATLADDLEAKARGEMDDEAWKKIWALRDKAVEKIFAMDRRISVITAKLVRSSAIALDSSFSKRSTGEAVELVLSGTKDGKAVVVTETPRTLDMLKALEGVLVFPMTLGTVQVVNRPEGFRVDGTWVHSLGAFKAVGEKIQAVKDLSTLTGEICVTWGEDPAFGEITRLFDDTAKLFAVVFDGTVVDFFNRDMASRYDMNGRRVTTRPCATAESEGWLVPANAKVVGVLCGLSTPSEDVEALLAAGYNVALGETTKGVTGLGKLPRNRDGRGTLVILNNAGMSCRVPDEFRPWREDRPLSYGI